MDQRTPQPPPSMPLSAAPPTSGALFAAGLQHHKSGDLAQAEARYRQALALDPQHDDSLHLLGVVAFQTGRQSLGLELIGKSIALSPDKPNYHSNLGNMFLSLGRKDQAEACYRKVLVLTPGDAEMQNRLGDLLYQQDRLDEAAACFQTAVRHQPDSADAHNNLGAVAHRQDKLEQAVAHYRHALALDAGSAQVRRNLGDALRELEQFVDAVGVYRDALTLEPDHPATLNKLGACHLRLDQLGEAAACFQAALQAQPGFADALSNLSVVHTRRAQPTEAIACCRAALAAEPDNPHAHYNLSFGLLATGAMEEGWREHEWRWTVQPGLSKRRQFTQPLWLGEPAAGRTLLVHAEQGYGDTIQFCRYLPMLRERGLRVVLEVFPPLVRLFQSMPGIAAVLSQGAPLPDFDLHCPMLSLPLAFHTTLETIPAAIPYLQPDAAQTEAWRHHLAATARSGPAVGLVWAGSPRPDWPIAAEIDRRRSLPPERLAPLLEVPGIQFYSLQKDGPPPPAGFTLHDPMQAVVDFADTAALLANLDLVISVDTAIVHLAGALGRPVWMLDRFDHCWRWLAGRRDNPWYPAMRIYRQPAPGDWDSVLAEVAGDLAALATAWQSAWSGAEAPDGQAVPTA